MQVLFPKIGAIFQNIYSIKTTADGCLCIQLKVCKIRLIINETLH